MGFQQFLASAKTAQASAKAGATASHDKELDTRGERLSRPCCLNTAVGSCAALRLEAGCENQAS